MFNAVKALLEAGKIDKEAAEALDGEITSAIKEVRDEAAKYRTKLKEAESLYKKQLDEQAAELKNALETAKQEGAEAIAKEYEAKLKALESEKAEYEARAREAMVEATINGVLADVDVVDADLARLYIRSHITVDGDKVFVKSGDELLTVESGAKKLFEAKPHLIKSTGSPGSGAGGRTGSMAAKKKSEMSAEDKAAYIKEHGQDAYLALSD